MQIASHADERTKLGHTVERSPREQNQIAAAAAAELACQPDEDKWSGARAHSQFRSALRFVGQVALPLPPIRQPPLSARRVNAARERAAARASSRSLNQNRSAAAACGLRPGGNYTRSLRCLLGRLMNRARLSGAIIEPRAATSRPVVAVESGIREPSNG